MATSQQTLVHFPVSLCSYLFPSPPLSFGSRSESPQILIRVVRTTSLSRCIASFLPITVTKRPREPIPERRRANAIEPERLVGQNAIFGVIVGRFLGHVGFPFTPVLPSVTRLPIVVVAALDEAGLEESCRQRQASRHAFHEAACKALENKGTTPARGVGCMHANARGRGRDEACRTVCFA